MHAGNAVLLGIVSFELIGMHSACKGLFWCIFPFQQFIQTNEHKHEQLSNSYANALWRNVVQ